MHLFVPLLLLVVGAGEGAYLQKLTCPHEARQRSLLRVWCRRTSTQCCTGFTFSPHAESLHGGKLRVSWTSDSFTVAMLQPIHGEGVYWCGVLSRNNTITKLTEGYFHSSYGAYIWIFARWILLPVLPMATIFTTIYSRRKPKHIHQKEEKLYENTFVARAQAENTELDC